MAEAKKSAKGAAPLSSHPAFPAIVALWFAALFGIGSLVLPSTLFERIIVATGLPAILPAAAPPLGFTARAMIALVATCAGLAIGLVLARRVAASQQPEQARTRDLQLNTADRHPDAPAKRPISARSELGSEGLGPVDDPWKFDNEWDDDHDDSVGPLRIAPASREDAAPEKPEERSAPPIPGRRRSLSVTDDSGPSDYLQTVPLPGQADDAPLDLHFPEESARPGPSAEPVAEVSRHEEGTFGGNGDARPVMDIPEAFAIAEDDPAGAQDDVRPFDGPPEFPARPSNQIETSPVQDHLMTQSDTPAAHETLGKDAAPAAHSANTGANFGRFAEYGMAELVERFASALQAKSERDQARAAPVEREPALAPDFAAPPSANGANPFADRARELEDDAGREDAHRPFAAPAPSFAQQPENPADDADAADQPMVFRRSSGSAARIADEAGEASQDHAPAPAPAPAPEPRFGQGGAIPSALMPVAFDNEPDEDGYDDESDMEDDGIAFDLSMNLANRRDFSAPASADAPRAFDEPGSRPFSQPAAFDDDEQEEAEEDLSDDAYSSLLSMKSKLSGESFVRVEDEEPADIHGEPEPTVVFPGQHGQPRAVQDHTATQPVPEGGRPFDAPPADQAHAAPAPSPAAEPADPSETEAALREALEKLQRMSGAA